MGWKWEPNKRTKCPLILALNYILLILFDKYIEFLREAQRKTVLNAFSTPRFSIAMLNLYLWNRSELQNTPASRITSRIERAKRGIIHLSMEYSHLVWQRGVFRNGSLALLAINVNEAFLCVLCSAEVLMVLLWEVWGRMASSCAPQRRGFTLSLSGRITLEWMRQF